MPDGASFDFSELSRLAADIEKAPKSARPALRKATEITARKVKDSWKDKVSGSEGLGGLAAAVTYDVTSENSSTAGIEAEVGYDKGRNQGPLGNISEFGSQSEYGTPMHAPRGFGLAALQENEADFEYGIEKAIDDSLKGLGL